MRTAFEILRPPCPRRRKRFTRCENVGYKRRIAAMAQTSIISNQEQKNFKHSAASHHQEEHLLQAESSNKCGIDHRSTTEKHHQYEDLIEQQPGRTLREHHSRIIEQQPGRTLRTSQQDHRAATRTNFKNITARTRRDEHSTIDIILWSLKERLALLKITF